MCDVGRQEYREIGLDTRVTGSRVKRGDHWEGTAVDDALDVLASWLRGKGAATAFVATPQARSFIRGLTSCFLVTAAYYILHVFLVDRGNAGSLGPAVASWGATVLCGLAGAAAYARMKS